MLAFLAPCFAASLILAGIHAYLGVHVVERGVIFVDLSLAQIAALGATIALLMPFSNGDPHAPVVYWVSLVFTFMGAFVFCDDSQQARAHSAGSHHRHLLRRRVGSRDSGDEQGDVGERAPEGHARRQHPRGVVAGGGEDRRAVRSHRRSFHYVFRHKFLAISMNHEHAESTGLNVKFWDFLFYASFGFVVTSSVSIAGVLLVFCYLIVPSVAAMLYADSIGKRLAIGWTMGTIVSALGVFLSLQARPADRRDDRVHVRPRVGYHGSRASPHPAQCSVVAAAPRSPTRR